MFKCINCKKEISESGSIGTRNRNHCPHCLFSQHLDENIPGDRMSKCKGVMIPAALTLKKEKIDKYGRKKTGEIMIVHKCNKCGKISTNRIAGDDNPNEILNVLEKSVNLNIDGIKILTDNDKEEVKNQLFGKQKRQ